MKVCSKWTAINGKVLRLVMLCLCLQGVQAQFWKLKTLNDRDMFILETKASIASGICYRQMPRESLNPELRIQTISYCCDGYQQVPPQQPHVAALHCRPICMEDCSQGICTAPDTCECFPGYKRLGGRCEEA